MSAQVKIATAAPAKKKATASHPPTSEMVDAAISTLKERGGSSLLAVKKYLSTTYKVDTLKLAPFIKKYLKSAVEKGHLIQTKGKGAQGSFKLAAKSKTVAKPKKAAVEKKTVAKKAPVKGKTVEKKTSKAGPVKVKKPVAKKVSVKK